MKILLPLDNEKMVDLLIQHGANVNLAKNDVLLNNGVTPLMEAASQGNLMYCQ